MMQGAVILSIAALITKILSAIYRVPFQNMVGNTGFYVYQQVYPLYGLGMTFALSGFPVFLSNMVAQYRSEYQLKPLLGRSFVILSGLGMVIFLFLQAQAMTIAQLMGDELLTPVIQTVSWMFLVMPFLVIARGYFQGTMRMIPTAISQVVEQVVRVAVILVAAASYAQSKNDLYEMGSQAMSSATIAALCAMGVLGVYLVREWQQKEYVEWNGEQKIPSEVVRISTLSRRFLMEGGILCLLSSLLVLYQLVDSFTLFKGLVNQGIEEEVAKNLKGIFDRGQPLVQLGMVVGVGFSSSYMPLLTRAFHRGNREEFQKMKYSLLKMTTAFSVVATAGMLLILPRLNHMLFGDSEGNLVLAVYVCSVCLASLIMVYHGILQSIGKYFYTFVGLAVGLTMKWIFNEVLVSQMGTVGASIATILGLCGMLLVIYKATPHDESHQGVKRIFLKKLLGIVLGMSVVLGVMEVVLNGWIPIGQSRTLDSIIAVVEVGIGIVFFVAISLKVQLLTIREWVMIPKGKSLLRWTKQWKKEEK